MPSATSDKPPIESEHDPNYDADNDSEYDPDKDCDKDCDKDSDNSFEFDSDYDYDYDRRTAKTHNVFANGQTPWLERIYYVKCIPWHAQDTSLYIVEITNYRTPIARRADNDMVNATRILAGPYYTLQEANEKLGWEPEKHIVSSPDEVLDGIWCIVYPWRAVVPHY